MLHSRSSKMSRFDRVQMISYYRSVVFFLIICSCYVMQTLVQNRKFSRNIYSVSGKNLSPLRFSVFFPQRLIIFNQTFTRLLYVHVYGKLLNLIQLSLNMTELCHIKHNHRVTFHFSLTANCTDFIAKYEWRPNSPDLDPLDYHVWGEILQAFHKLHPKSKTIPELKGAQQRIWDDLPQTMINKAINDFGKRLNANGGHFEQMIWTSTSYRNSLTEFCLLFQKL